MYRIKIIFTLPILFPPAKKNPVALLREAFVTILVYPSRIVLCPYAKLITFLTNIYLALNMCQALTMVNKEPFSLPSRSLHSSMEKQTVNKIDMLIYCLL